MLVADSAPVMIAEESASPKFSTTSSSLCGVDPALLQHNGKAAATFADDNDDPTYAESRLAREHRDVAEFFAQNPHLQSRVHAALEKFSALHKPCKFVDTVLYQREAVLHFVANNSHSEFDNLEPFYVVDLGRVILQMVKFKKHLPMVQPFFAIKCNPSEALLSVLSAMGARFDCASQFELRKVLDGSFAPADEVIFANPCKQVADIRYAEEQGVRYVTFDNIDEISKLAEHMPHCRAVLRIKTDDKNASSALSTKFGASMQEVPELLQKAKDSSVKVVGCSFHVGTGNMDPQAYHSAIMNARSVFDIATSLGFEMKLLDIGGGFPGTDPLTDDEDAFVQIAANIRPLLTEQFPNAMVIAEPGRFFTANTYTLALNVHSRRKIPLRGHAGFEYQYYCNDGLYFSFNNIVFDHAHPELHLLNPRCDAPLHVSTIFGPTCDSIDCILKRQLFPEMALGEWLFVPVMGSYTVSCATPFNGFSTRRVEYVNSVPFDFSPSVSPM